MNSSSQFELPRMIRCAACKRNLLHVRFSARALQNYKTSLEGSKKGDPSKGYPFCNDCSASNREEMHCAGCNRTYGLEYFSKAQRKHPDNAYCLTCQQEREDLLPNIQDAIVEEEILQEILSNQSDTSTEFSRSFGHSVQNDRKETRFNYDSSSSRASSTDGSENDGVWIGSKYPGGQDMTDLTEPISSEASWSYSQSSISPLSTQRQVYNRGSHAMSATRTGQTLISLGSSANNEDDDTQSNRTNDKGFAKVKSTHDNREYRIQRRIMREEDRRRLIDSTKDDIREGDDDDDESDFEL